MNFFKSKKEELPAPRALEAPDQSTSRQYLMNYINSSKARPAPAAYPGQLSAEAPDYESNIPGLTTGYVNRVAPYMQRDAEDLLSKTMLGKFDPYTSDYYKAYRAGAEENLAEAQTKARQSAQIGGMLRSSGRLNAENKLIRGTTNDLNSIMAQLATNERQNQINAVAPALNQARYNEEAPLRSLEVIKSSGTYESARRQAELDRMREEFIREISEEKFPLQLALSLANPSMYNYFQPQYQTTPSAFDKYGMPIIQTAMMAAAAGSDRALKKNIVKIGQTKDGINIYKWEWKEFAKNIVGNAKNIGVIAQEVLKIKPEAVMVGNHGYLMVNYSLI